jgi:hypothetical protein
VTAHITHDNPQRFSLTGADSSNGVNAVRPVRRAAKRKTLRVINSRPNSHLDLSAKDQRQAQTGITKCIYRCGLSEMRDRVVEV